MNHHFKTHWQTVYQTKASTDVSWYQPVPRLSLELIHTLGLSPEAALLDVGGGSSTLVDHLLKEGFTNITVLDLAAEALVQSQKRLGDAASRAQWIEADITVWQPSRRYDLWHDRAVFHFMIDPALRSQYIKVLKGALTPGGHVVIATFGPDAPTRCSGLDVCRYSAADLNAVLGPTFRFVRSEVEEHITPAGRTQQFLYGLWRTEA